MVTRHCLHWNQPSRTVRVQSFSFLVYLWTINKTNENDSVEHKGSLPLKSIMMKVVICVIKIMGHSCPSVRRKSFPLLVLSSTCRRTEFSSKPCCYYHTRSNLAKLSMDTFTSQQVSAFSLRNFDASLMLKWEFCLKKPCWRYTAFLM